MTEFTLKLATHAVAVRTFFESTREYCKEYLSHQMPEITLEITREDLAVERKKSAQTDTAEGVPVRNLTDAQLEITALQRKIAQKLFLWDTLVFHGSAVAVDGNAYLFTAKSGTGKSTHTRLWREAFGDRAVMINDDKPFLLMKEEGVLVCGSPWNGKHRLGADLSVPLKAVCLLERGEQNEIRKLTAVEALPVLLQQSSRPIDGKLLPQYMELIDRLACNAEFFRLRCNMDPEAARVSFEAMALEHA